jgi:hypothetical protein
MEEKQTLIDAMIVDYLVNAMDNKYYPNRDSDQKLRMERVAAFRLFLWAQLSMAPSANRQLRQTKNPEWLGKLERLVLIHLGEPQIDSVFRVKSEIRAKELNQHHSDLDDCLIVAEAELLGCSALVTFDSTLKKRLSSVAQLPITTTSEEWNRLAIPRGKPSCWQPADSNPKLVEQWWRWK